VGSPRVVPLHPSSGHFHMATSAHMATSTKKPVRIVRIGLTTPTTGNRVRKIPDPEPACNDCPIAAAIVCQRVARGLHARRLASSKRDYLAWAYDACVDDGAFLSESDVYDALLAAKLGALGQHRLHAMDHSHLATIDGDMHKVKNETPWKLFL